MLHYTEAIGLDIGSHAAKAVHVRRRWGRVSIETSVWVRLPENAEERQRVLASFVAKNGWRGLPCVVAPPVDGVMLQTITVPPQDPRPVTSIVDLELSQLSGLTEATTVRDYTVSRNEGGGKRILLAVARADSVQNAVDLAAASGLHPVQVTPQATALFNTIIRRWRGGRKSRFVVVDVGHRRTTILVGTRTQLIDARHIPTGGSTFGEGVRALGAVDGDSGAAEMERWIEALSACLSVCLGTGDSSEAPAVDGIVLSGGGAYIDGLKERLAAPFRKPIISLGDLARTSHVEDTERMALARGLALAGMGIGRIQLTLLPAATREAITLHSQARYWMASGVALIVALLILLTGAGFDLHRKQAALSEARSRLNTIVSSESTLKDLRDRNSQLEARVRPFAALVHNGAILRTVIGAIPHARHADDWLVRIADADSYFNESETTTGGIPSINRMVTEGYTPATDLSNVRSMIETLRFSPGILDADLLGDDAIPEAEDSTPAWQREEYRPFAIELTLPTP